VPAVRAARGTLTGRSGRALKCSGMVVLIVKVVGGAGMQRDRTAADASAPPR